MNQPAEASELLQALKDKLQCRTDQELADYLDVATSQISRWRHQGLPKAVKSLILLQLRQHNAVSVEILDRTKIALNCKEDLDLAELLNVREDQIQSWRYKPIPEFLFKILDKILPAIENAEDPEAYEIRFHNRPCVYFVQSVNNGLIKIGYTTDLKKRLSRMRVDSPYPLKVLFALDATQIDERWIHSGLMKYRDHGEWFLPSTELIEFIEEQKFESRLE